MSHKSALIESMILPPIPVWAAMQDYSIVYLEAKENYQKRSFRNRFYLAGPQGRALITVPLDKGKNKQMPIKEVKITRDQLWARNALRLIQSNYGSAPFFDYIFDDLKKIFDKRHQSLFEFNKDLFELCLEHLQLSIEIKETDAFLPVGAMSEFRDLRYMFKPTEAFFAKEATSYEQVFTTELGFIPNLSILDLLMCRGPEAYAFL